MKILALPALYLVYKGLTTGAGVTLLPSVPETPEEKVKREEIEQANKESVETAKKQKEKDEAEREDKFKQEQNFLAGVPNVSCAPNKKPVRYGSGTRADPFYWVCEVKKFGL